MMYVDSRCVLLDVCTELHQDNSQSTYTATSVCTESIEQLTYLISSMSSCEDSNSYIKISQELQCKQSF